MIKARGSRERICRYSLLADLTDWYDRKNGPSGSMWPVQIFPDPQSGISLVRVVLHA